MQKKAVKFLLYGFFKLKNPFVYFFSSQEVETL